ncbi:hypothetical protein [Sphingomonas sp.]|uniref:hypothetical protein n=1 Tax=Sphingomonas sp. TaxID=28214 RepID=UPI003BA94BC2
MTTLRGITWDHPRGYDPLVVISTDYLREHGTTIQWDRRSLQDFADYPIRRLAERYDLIVLDHPHIGAVAAERCVLPLPETEPDSTASIGGSAESYVWEGLRWAYAIDAACQMAVRIEHATAPLPRYWHEFLADDAARLRAVTPLKPVDAFDMWLTLLASLGCALPATGQTFATSRAGERAFAILHALYRLGPEEALNWNPIHILELLSDGDGEFEQSPCLFGYVNYAVPGVRRRRLAYYDLPIFEPGGVRRAILGGAGLAVSAHCRDPEAAIAFAKWAASLPVQNGLYLAGNGQPAHRHCWEHRRDDARTGGFFGGGFATIDAAWIRPRESWFPDFVDTVCENISPLIVSGDGVAFCAMVDRAYRHHSGVRA